MPDPNTYRQTIFMHVWRIEKEIVVANGQIIQCFQSDGNILRLNELCQKYKWSRS